MRIGILGAGHAGLTLFACLEQIGIRARLYSHPEHSRLLDGILREGGLLHLTNNASGATHTVRVCSDDVVQSAAQIVQGCDVVFNTTPVNAHDALFEEVIDGQRKTTSLTYVYLGGGFSVFAHRAAASAMRLDVSLCTFHTLPFASRVLGNHATLLNVRPHTSYAFAGKTSLECIALLERMFPSRLEEDENMLHMSLDRSSYVMHPLLTLFNVNRIERREPFYFYADGFCNSIKTLLVRAGMERRALAHCLGFFDYPDPSQRLADFERNYGEDFKSIQPPTTLNHRYIFEDIPFGLVPICGLGEVFGVQMPVCRSIVDIASAAIDSNLWETPYNVARNPVLLGAFLQGQRAHSVTHERAATWEALA